MIAAAIDADAKLMTRVRDGEIELSDDLITWAGRSTQIQMSRLTNSLRLRRSSSHCKTFDSLIFALLIAGLSSLGCNRKAGDHPTLDSAVAENAGTQPQHPVDHLSEARRMLHARNWGAAAKSAHAALVKDPENLDAKLIASEIEAARGNHQVSAELAASVDPRSRLGRRAIQLHYQQLVKLNRPSDAADVLLAALDVRSDVPQWRHHAWELLNRTGRREEASRQAEALCRVGQATEPELLSLVRRTESFPTVLAENTDPTEYFDPGLGMARWYFTEKEFRRAIEELSPQYESGFRSIAAHALYGRLLAETQAYEEMPAWHAQCDPQRAREFGDYWAALGTYFFDHRHYEASARALLEAVKRNPTDRLCLQRLARVFDAIGRPDDGEQFRRRGIAISGSERLADAVRSPSATDARKNLMRQMLELGRPFETLAWTLTVMPANATAERASVRRQRDALLRSKDALVMASESSLLGIDPTEFSVEPGYGELLSGGEELPKERSSVFEPLAQPRLVNVAGKVGIEFQWYQDLEVNIASIPIHESVGGGIAVIDYDLDGWPDVYLAQGSGKPPTDTCTRSNELMRNVNARFTEVTSLAGVEDFNFGAGLAAGDVNQDGFTDLFVGSLGHNRLLINNGDGTFHDDTSQLGEVVDRFTTSLAIADINGDSLPDLFEAIYIEMEGAFELPEIGEDGHEIQPSPLQHFAQSDRWFENVGDGRFQIHEIAREVARPGTSLGVVVTDFDADGSNEVFVGNDVRPNHFLVQSGNNQLVNTADARGLANGFNGVANGCMGIATGDFNRDGTLDLHITNFNQESNNLYLQQNGGAFADRAIRYGLDQLSLPYVGFGTKAIDVDRNGELDLIITNGHIFDMRGHGEGFQMPPQFLMRRGSRFELVSVDDDSGYWDKTYLGRSIAMLDFDRDGALDFLVSHLDQPMAVLHNQTKTQGNGMQFELVGTSSERDAIGARVRVTTGEIQQTQWVTAGDGYYCSDEPIIDYGLGTSSEVTRVDVHWPSGRQQTFRGLGSARYLIVEGESEPYTR